MARLLETLNPIEALVHETLNGEYELTFTTTARDVNKFDLLSAHTPNGRQLFRVAGVTNHADKSEIFARHVFFDLSGNFSLGFDSKDVTCQTMINKFVSSLTEPLAPFALSTDITDRNSYNPEEANALEILSHGKRSIVGVNDAELLRDNYAVKLQKRLGSDTNVLIHPRNNILDLKREYSSDDICTKIFLRGGNEEAPLEATITSPLIDKYPVVYARRYQNETDSITTVEQLIAWGKLHFDTDRIDVPKLSFDFDVFGDLGLQLGDSALVRVPELDVDVRSRVTGYDYDPMTRKYVKLYFGDKSTGLAGFIGDTTTGIVDEAVKNVDEKLQAEIDNANEAIQKEYEARVEAVDDAIAKAEADAEVMKEALQTEISQAVTDWNTEFEEAKTNIDNSIGNVSKELGEYIESTDEIIERVDSELSELFDGLEANSGAITTITTEQGILSAKVGEVVVTADSALSKATEAQITADGFSTRVGSLETSDSTQNSNISQLQQTASGLTSTVSSHTSSINGLNSTVSTHTSEIKQTSDKISMVVSNGSTASTVQLTPNALTAIAKDINLKGNVQFNSLVEGDGTNTQILGGKIKTNSISASKLIVGNSQSLVKLTKGENIPNTDIVSYHPYWGLTFKDEGLPVCSLTPHFNTGEALSTEQLGWANKEIKLRITHNIFYGPYVPFYFQVYCFDDNGAVTLSAQTEQINPSHNVNSIQNHVIDLGVIDQNKHRYVYIRLLRPTTESFGEYGVNTLTITEMNAGELIVDGAIRANHIVSGSAELGAVTSKVLSTEALNAAWANIGNAFINKLTSDDALFQRLTAKTAWITSANIVSLEASSIKGKVLSSTNGGLKFDLDGNRLTLNENSVIKYGNADTNINIETRFGTNSYTPQTASAISDSLGVGSTSIVGTSIFCNNYGTITGIYQVPSNVQGYLGSILHHAERHVFATYNTSLGGQGVELVCSRALGMAVTGTQFYPRTNNHGLLGKSDKAWHILYAYNFTDMYSSTLADDSYQNETLQINALDIVNNATVEQATPIMTMNEENDGKRQLLGINLNKAKLTADDEMPTLNEEIAILWKAVQELSEQNKALRDEIALERSERETLHAENEAICDDVATLRTQLNALTDLIAGKATVTVRT